MEMVDPSDLEAPRVLSPEERKIRWMVEFTLPDCGLKASFPFTTKAKVQNISTYFNDGFMKANRLRENILISDKPEWAAFLDLSFKQICDRIEELRKSKGVGEHGKRDDSTKT